MRWRRYFNQAREQAAADLRSAGRRRVIEQNIGLKAHIQRAMPMFLTLRDNEGTPLATAMLPPAGQTSASSEPIIVGPGNSDPYPGAWRGHQGAGTALRIDARSGALLPVPAGVARAAELAPNRRMFT